MNKHEYISLVKNADLWFSLFFEHPPENFYKNEHVIGEFLHGMRWIMKSYTLDKS
jgi:hypothetical protein